MMTDEQLILLILKSDKQHGFKLLFYRYYRPMCVFGSKYINSIEVVEDIVQEILICLWNCKTFDRFTNLKSYLFTSVKNKCLSAIRKESPLSLNDSDLIWESDLFIQEDSKELIEEHISTLNRAISELSPACQEVFKMVAIERLKYREVADELNISINTVKTQVKKAYRLINAKLLFSTLMSSIFCNLLPF